MTNPLRGEVELVVGKTTYTLRLSINEIISLQRITGLKVMAISAALSAADDVDIDLWRSALWASLQGQHADMSLEDAGEIIAQAGMPEIMAKVGEALQAAFPTGTPAGKPSPRKASRSGTGKP